MALKDYYGTLPDQSPRKLLRDKILKECGVDSVQTVYRWISGEIMPDKLKREKIAEIVGLPVDDLFPGIEDSDNGTK